jgi:hypothetical protein
MIERETLEWIWTWVSRSLFVGLVVATGVFAYIFYDATRMRWKRAEHEATRSAQMRADVVRRRAEAAAARIDLMARYERAREAESWTRAHQIGTELSRRFAVPPPGFREVTEQWSDIQRDTFRRARRASRAISERARRLISRSDAL